ncbi:hypothetical protein [Algibacillus agarilyticus]|uniref:hypothetical protein n=1 Tax=Algibacillus agarilyticus TaxID=2234133 RepID=UPI000DD06A41|nr:hypothetical protein [Algibacillus agarilyticus]
MKHWLLFIIAGSCLLACSSMDYHQHVGQQFAHLGYGKATRTPNKNNASAPLKHQPNQASVNKINEPYSNDLISQEQIRLRIKKQLPTIAERLAYELGKQHSANRHFNRSPLLHYQPLVTLAKSPIELEISEQLDRLLPFNLQSAGLPMQLTSKKAANISRLSFIGQVKLRNQQLEFAVSIKEFNKGRVIANYVLIVPLS